MYRLWNCKLNHYQYYEGGEEMVELVNFRDVKLYVKKHKGEYRVDWVFIDSGEIKEDVVSLKN